MLQSLRSRLIFASILWTAGLLLLMHMLTILLLHAFPGARASHGFWPSLAGLAAMCTGFYGARQSLAPFRRLRARLSSVRCGKDRRVAGMYPTEVQPLIDDLNALLDDRDKSISRALATAGDLAHGLKTPLALLAYEADCAEKAGNEAIAKNIRQQVERMSRQVTYHLARARASASGKASGIQSSVADCAAAVIRAVEKLYASRALSISSVVEPDLRARVQREDLEEILGNLLDNASKWAQSKVVVKATKDGDMLILTIGDDGSGLPDGVRVKVFERGVRADESAPGSGMGLAIVQDLAELYGGSIVLGDSRLGGLEACVRLPAG